MMITERILQVIDKKGITKYKFCKDLGLSNGFLDKPREIATDKYANILDYFKDINPQWLLTGRGRMIKTIGLMTDDEIAAQDADANVNSGEAVPSIVLNNPSYQNLLNKVQEQAAEIAALNVELKDAYKEISVLQKELRTAEKQ